MGMVGMRYEFDGSGDPCPEPNFPGHPCPFISIYIHHIIVLNRGVTEETETRKVEIYRFAFRVSTDWWKLVLLPVVQ